MDSFNPADNASAGIEADSGVNTTHADNRARGDTPGTALSVEVLNQRLHDQQFYTRSLIESNIDSLMTTDTRGVIADVNQQMVDLTGRTRDELIGAPCRNFFTNPTRADRAITRVLQEDRIKDYELTVRSFDGSETVVSYNAATLRDRDRTVRGVVAVARDVTESKRFERALLDKNFKLEQANVARAEFLARARVEVLSPMHTLVSSAEALSGGVDGDLTEAQRDRVDGIRADGARLYSLLDELIGMSTVETGIVQFTYEPVDVQSLLVASAALVNQTGDPAVTVTVGGAGDVGDFPLDSANTGQILAVMLDNAVVASSGGCVTVQASVVPRSAVGEFDGRRPHWSCPLPESGFLEFLEIRVTDSGVGISAADLSSVFLPLRHGEFDTVWKSSGNGVGLAMVKLLIQLQGGAVGVEGVLGDGATFAVWLPRRVLPAVPDRANVNSDAAGTEAGTEAGTGARAGAGAGAGARAGQHRQ
jgi:PAS domain S-box-containing protein